MLFIGGIIFLTGFTGTYRNLLFMIEYSIKTSQVASVLFLCCDAALVKDVSQDDNKIWLNVFQRPLKGPPNETGE